MQPTKFLIIDDDPAVYALIAEQILVGRDIECLQASDGEEGLKKVRQQPPDLILLDLVLPGLAGIDTLVGIKQAEYNRPIIVTTQRGEEQKAIEAFRLGATDFITKPIRPPELLTSVERALEQVTLMREKSTLLEQVQASHAELEAKVKELTLLTNIGQLMTGLQNIEELFEIILASMLDMIRADHATIMLRDINTNKLRLTAGRNLTLVMQENLGQEVKDDLAELVMASKEPLVAAGEGLQRFRLSREIRAVVYVPVVAHGQPIGVLTVGNHRQRGEFSDKHAQLLKAMADYVAMGMTNVRLFRALEMRAHSTEEAMQAKDAERNALVESLKQKLSKPLAQLEQQLGQLGSSKLPDNMREQIHQMQADAREMAEALQQMLEPRQERISKGIYRISQ